MKMGQPRSAPPVRAGEGEGEGEGEEGEGGTSREEMGGKEGEQKTQCHIRALVVKTVRRVQLWQRTLLSFSSHLHFY